MRPAFLPASHAITASTANSGSVCSQASAARASPWEIRNCAASAPQATRKAESRMDGKVHSAERAAAPAATRVVTAAPKAPSGGFAAGPAGGAKNARMFAGASSGAA
jgi:hypothetical protein